MERRDFIRLVGLLPLTAQAMKLNALNKIVEPFATTDPMPVLFVGHGNPMNAIEENEFTKVGPIRLSHCLNPMPL